MSDITGVPAAPNVLMLSPGSEAARAVAAQLRDEGFGVTLEEPSHFGVDLDGADAILIDQVSGDLPWPFDPATLWQPVLVIGADNSSEICAAFSRGIADYVTPPPRVRELASRIRAALRRRAYTPAPARVHLSDHGFGLSDHEQRLLASLVANAGQVVTRAEIARRVWGDDVEARVLADQMRRLRAKLARVDGCPIEITPVRGVGYRVSPA